MHILFVSQYFPPEMGAPAARVYELSREWVRQGERVTVLTGFPHHPTGVKAPGDRWRLTRRETVDGIEVMRSYVYATPNRGVARRMVSYASFMASATPMALARCRWADVVVGTSPQLLGACAGYLVARLWRRPFVFEVRDLWPESILAVSAMQNNRLIGALRRVAAHLYRRSHLIVTVGQGYKRQINRLYGTALDKMEVVPNGIDPQLFQPGPRRNAIRDEYGWGDKFVLLYLGTLGMAHRLEVVLEAADTLRDDPDTLFVLVGEGARKNPLRDLATDLRLPNVQFIGQQPKERVPLFYSASDVGLVTLRDTPLFQEVLPSKIFEILAMERPILLSVGGQARELVESSGGGVYVPPGDSAALVAAIRSLQERSSALREMGRLGRKFVLEHYDRREQARRYLELLRGVVKSSNPSRSKGEA